MFLEVKEPFLKMAVSKTNKKKQQCYIAVPSQIINSLSSSGLQSLLLSPKKKNPSFSVKLKLLLNNPRFWVLFLFVFGFVGMLKMWLNFETLVPFAPNPCGIFQEKTSFLNDHQVSQLSIGAVNVGKEEKEEKEEEGDEKNEFWKQPDGLGYRPCLDFSSEYRKTSLDIVKGRTRYLMVVVSGGMNQQRNQIVDAVVIARILGAALVVPILQVNVIWGDERFEKSFFTFQLRSFVIPA